MDLTDTKTLYIASDSPTSQYRNKNNVFLTKKWAIDNNIDIYWIFTEAGHGKGPMDGVGSTIKRVIKDTIAFHPNEVIRNTDQLLKYLKIDDIIIGTYKDNDVKNISSVLPNSDNLVIIKSGYGLAKVHEIYFSKEYNNIIKWKKISSDSLYSTATIKVKGSLKKKVCIIWYTVIVNSIIDYLIIDSFCFNIIYLEITSNYIFSFKISVQTKKCQRKQSPKTSQKDILSYLKITKNKQVKRKLSNDGNESNSKLSKGK